MLSLIELQYQLTFENKARPPIRCFTAQLTNKQTDWSQFYAPAPEIRQDLERVVEKYGLMRYIRLQHEILRADFDEVSGKWILKIRRPRQDATSPADGHPTDQFEEFTDTADLLVSGTGSIQASFNVV